MNYIIYDLEFNQKNYNTTEPINGPSETEIINNTSLPFEIIQIGAVKLDENFQKLGTLLPFLKIQCI